MRSRKKGLLFLLTSGLVCGYIHAQQAGGDEFIIAADAQQAKKQSKNALKEQVGYATRDAFSSLNRLNRQLAQLQTACAHMHVSACKQNKKQSVKSENLAGVNTLYALVGDMQTLLADVQQTLSTSLEKLLDNLSPFKKATRIELDGTRAVMQKIQATCEQQQGQVRVLCSLCKAGADLATCEQHVATMHKKLTLTQSVVKQVVQELDSDVCIKKLS
ncbi:MAG: hypothetical protein H6679_05230 [Epsilonproteobacteria bacterium]|nr:hypothetical protein [Campylobacterota bacterium]